MALFSLLAASRLVPETRELSAGRPDLAGATLLAAALVAVVYPLLEGRRLGWPAWGWLLLAAGLVTLTALGLVEERRQRPQFAPLLGTRLFRIPAFTAGLAVQLTFAAGLQGLFLTMALWLQTGQHYSPLRAGLTTVAFSVGSFLAAPVAVPLAQRYGRLALASGGLLLTLGTFGINLGAHHVGVNSNPWPVVPGLVVAGIGLALLVIPLANVALAAVPAQTAGGASGLFSTVQSIGGAIGIAAIGTVFFSYLNAHPFTAAFTHSAVYAAAAFLVSGALSLALPRTAVADPDAEPSAIHAETNTSNG